MSTTNPATPQMKREDYKAVKHMDRATLTAYLSRIYRRGYEAGLKAGADIETSASSAKDAANNGEGA